MTSTQETSSEVIPESSMADSGEIDMVIIPTPSDDPARLLLQLPEAVCRSTAKIQRPGVQLQGIAIQWCGEMRSDWS